MGKTVLEIANEIGVSKQAVYKKIKRSPLSTALQNELTVVDNKTYISLTGEKLIKQAFSSSKQTTVNHQPVDEKQSTMDTVYTLLQQTIVTLQQQLSVKDSQLAAKDAQISELTATIKAQAESINADRHNALAETLIERQIEEQSQSTTAPVPAPVTGFKAWVVTKLGGKV